MDHIYYLACEQRRPYRVFDNLKAARDEIQPYLDKGYDFQVAQVRVTAFHEGNPWVCEPA